MNNETNNQSLEKKFQVAVDIIQNLPKDGPVTTSNDEKLLFYGLFKQATIGPCKTSRPSMFSIVEKYKYDAWKKNERMSKEEAMESYVEELLKKINNVEKTYDTAQWLSGDLYELLVPKFAVIGKIYKKAGDKEEKQPVQEEHKPVPLEESVLSETEYCDAIDEDDELLRSRSSSYDLQGSPRPKKNRLKQYCSRVEAELKTISEQIERLSTTIEQRHTSLLNVFKKATVYMFVPRSIPWRAIFFFFIWPFVAHFLIRYFGRRILLRLQ